MLRLLIVWALLSSGIAYAQADTIRIHFLYGSKPAKGFKGTERKLFGGSKGGHVNIEANGKVLDFMPGKCPLFPDKRTPSGGFRINRSVYWDTATNKWATILVPVTPLQMQQLDSLFILYKEDTPFDYAVFGMRCAAASYFVLSQVGLQKEMSSRQNIISHFYPKLLRKRVFKWARKNNYPIIEHAGRRSRKWEKDAGMF